MALPTNILQQVITYQRSGLAYLLNSCCFVSTANTKFKDFDRIEANLGDTISFDLPPRYTVANTLVANFQASQQRVQNLAVKQAANTSYAFSNQQFIFNSERYMDQFGKSAIKELANNIEANIALNAVSGVPLDPNNANFAPDPTSGPYRFFGNGITPIDSYGQLAQALANFRDFGAAQDSTKVYLPLVSVPAIVNSGLNQFVLKRNEEIANSWWLGDFSEASFYQSNLLPVHIAGTVGNANPATPLTVVSTNDPTGNNITQITFSGATASDPNAIFAGDLFQFSDGVTGISNVRFLTFIGHSPSQQPVQFRATASAGAAGSGNVVVNILPGLCSTAGSANQNITSNIIAGMQVTVVPSHRAGLIVGGNALFLAMPKLPEETPFPTANDHDPDTGVSLRYYYGSLFGQNQRGFVHDCIWGSNLVPEYCMRLCLPM
jgi:hypothetical protein